MVTKKGLFVRTEEHHCASDEMRTCVDYIPPTVDDIRAWCEENDMALVPIEPTEAMIDTGDQAILKNGPWAIVAYDAMLRAAEESTGEDAKGADRS